jgi:hypothetical protein
VWEKQVITRSVLNRLVFSLLMGMVTTSVVVLISVYFQTGMSGDLLIRWFSGFIVAYPAVVILILVVANPLQRLVFRFSQGSHIPTLKSRISFALLMGSITVSTACMTGVLVLSGNTPDLFNEFFSIFPLAYIVALPFILIVAPRIQLFVDRRFIDQERRVCQ